MFKPFAITPKINKALVERNILKKIGERKGTYYILSSKVIEKYKGHYQRTFYNLSALGRTQADDRFSHSDTTDRFSCLSEAKGSNRLKPIVVSI